MILPSMGVVTEVSRRFCSKKPFGYTFIAFSSIAIAVFGFLVWGHHLFVCRPVRSMPEWCFRS